MENIKIEISHVEIVDFVNVVTESASTNGNVQLCIDMHDYLKKLDWENTPKDTVHEITLEVNDILDIFSYFKGKTWYNSEDEPDDVNRILNIIKMSHRKQLISEL